MLSPSRLGISLFISAWITFSFALWMLWQSRQGGASIFYAAQRNASHSGWTIALQDSHLLIDWWIQWKTFGGDIIIVSSELSAQRHQTLQYVDNLILEHHSRSTGHAQAHYSSYKNNETTAVSHSKMWQQAQWCWKTNRNCLAFRIEISISTAHRHIANVYDCFNCIHSCLRLACSTKFRTHQSLLLWRMSPQQC